MLRLRELRKDFGDGVVALDGLDLDVVVQRITTLVGPSGCGKSTVLRCVAGLERPDAGRIELSGRALFDPAAGVDVPAADRGLGFVPQSFALWPHLTAARTVAFPLEMARRGRRLSRGAIRDRVERTLGLVRLEGLEDRRPAELSGGQQQRLALARALALEPPLLLMDEPLSNLDAPLREELRVELKRLQQEVGVTILFVTHDRDEALALANVTAVMRAGRIEQVGKPREIYERPATRFVAAFVGRANVLPGVSERPGVVATAIGTVAVDLDAATVGDRVTVALRAEQISLSRDDDRGVRGLVRTRVYRGDAIDHIVEVGGSELRVRCPPGTSLRPGTPVALRATGHAVCWTGPPAGAGPGAPP
jgi:iron(III) transport system ATP-binding protein